MDQRKLGGVVGGTKQSYRAVLGEKVTLGVGRVQGEVTRQENTGQREPGGSVVAVDAIHAQRETARHVAHAKTAAAGNAVATRLKTA
jgi:hypothetical protein